MRLILFVILAVFMEQTRCEMEKRWCKKVVNKVQNVAGAGKQNKTVICSDLYKFLQQGWRYDEVKMKESGTQINIGLDEDRFMCHIYKNEKTYLQNVATNVLECCNGWAGDKCQHRREKLGTCYYDDRCARSEFSRSENIVNRRVFSKPSCCNMLGGIAWQSLKEHSSNSTINECLKCTNTGPEKGDFTRTCMSINRDKYIKFDGKSLTFSSICSYRLATSIDGTWWIDIQNQACKNITNICSKKLRISTQDEVIITLIDEDIYFNEVKISRLGFYTKQGVIIQQNDKFVTLKTSVGVTVRWDRKLLVMVILDENLATAGGLCGSYLMEGDWTGYDIKKPIDQNDISKHSTASNNRQCTIDTPKPKCSGSNFDRVSKTCSFILDADAFFDCRQIVDPFLYFEICISSLCDALDNDKEINNTFCDVATAYMMSCAQRGGKIKAWMKESGCSWNCPTEMEFIECASECPLTCDSQKSNDALCHEYCTPGCRCPSNTVLNPPINNKHYNEKVCIPVEQCPCKHAGKIYGQGAVIQRDCNTCFCGARGVWNCSDNLCHGVCHVISARLVITFDDSKYSFDADVDCRHQVLVQTMSRDFMISAEIMRSESIDDVSDLQHVRSVTLRLRERIVKINRNFKLTINGSHVTLPFRNNDITIRQATTHSWVVKGFGFSIYWTPFSEQITIVLEAAFANRVFGLCGTFTWNPHDDFSTLDGAVEKVPYLFVRNFQFKGNWDSCLSQSHNVNSTKITDIGNVISNLFSSDPCSTHAQRKAKAQEICGILDSSFFQNCRNLVDVEAYEEACYFDVCTSHDNSVKASCRSLSSYAQVCLQLLDKNISILNWRSHPSLNGQCDIHCPSHLTFDECRPISSSFCSDVSQPLPSYNNLTVNEFEHMDCLPGCICSKDHYISPKRTEFGRFETRGSLSVVRGLVKKGFEINDEIFQCVSISECPCEHRGKTFNSGESFKTGCVTCLCKTGKWICTSKDCGAIVKCPSNLVFSHSISLCDQLTCENFDKLELFKERGDCHKELHFQGCKCAPGYVLQDNSCILPVQCPCYYSGKIYARNQTRKQDCNTCTCLGRKWSCTNEKCSSQCIITGDPHYVTFDGTKYSFQGTCSYILSQEINGLFTITSENVPCGFNDVTCTKSVFVTVGSNTVHLLRGKKITINGVRVARLPRRYGDHKAVKYPSNISVSNNDTTTMSIDTSGIYIVVTWPVLGLSVLWDGGTRVVIQLSPIHYNKVVGLCGNFDNNLVNDFTTRSGSMETLQTIFADSWKVSHFCSETTTAKNSIFMNPCEANLHRSSWARKKCGVIQNGNLFLECRKLVDHTKFYEWCVVDACACNSGGDCECVCTAIAAYAQRCNENNVPVRWRSQDLCPLQCENGAVYLECGLVCQRTCHDKDQIQPNYCSTLNCVEGCFCPPHTVLHNQRCIPSHECPCFHEEGEFQVGTQLNVNCQNCTCISGNWECMGEKCRTLASSCGENEFLCKGTYQCIPSSWRCDYEFDCFDRSDEVNCNRTLSDCQFEGGHFCDHTNCLSIESRCDGIVDCQDHSDEFDCDVIIDQDICNSSQYECKNGKCISNGLVCDGNYNCGFGDFSDENNCAGDCSILTNVQCYGAIKSTCIQRRQYCDGISDCPNNYDEKDCVCDVTKFTCATSMCVARSSVCDGIRDCEQGEDEMNCDSINLHSTTFSTISTTVSTMTNNTNKSVCQQFQCESESRKCLLWSQLCDEVIDCIDRSDETEFCWQGCHSDEFSCDGGTKCLQSHELCDGNPVCQDNSDENVEACESLIVTDFTCNGFQCHDEICINGSMVCDGVVHCANNEDEIGCHTFDTTFTPPVFSVSTTVAPTLKCDGLICSNGQCIALERICNGVDDCLDSNSQKNLTSSDELYCSTWNNWSNWGECSQTCGSGFQTRNRSCVPPSGQNKTNTSTDFNMFRSKCVGKNIISKPCFRSPCRNKTHLTNWSSWSACSASCGGGLSNRRRTCSDETCSTALSSGRHNLGPPILEIKSCAEHLCPDETCAGNKINHVCDSNASDSICPLTCYDFVRGTGTNCVEERKDSDCVSGCFCPSGFVALNKSSDICVKKDECPCFQGGKVYEIGDEVLLTENCEKCRCEGAGKWGNCIVDPSCELPACGWTPWSNWGPCFGPCGINGVQWAFRSPSRPSRYGAKQQCQGVHRKSRRCPTKQCKYCDVISGKQRAVGDKWKADNCQICSCQENQTVHCTKYCDYAVTGCPNNQTLVQTSDNSQCCFCTSQSNEITPVIHDITTPSFIKEVLTDTSIVQTTIQENQNFVEQTTSRTKIQTTQSTIIHTSSTQDSSLRTTESSNIGSGDFPECRDDEFQCKTSMECVSSSSICDGISNCEDSSDESLEECQHHHNRCQYTSWSLWSECSKSCGLGKQMKFRASRREDKTDEDCQGPYQIFRACYEKSCTRDGAWSSWKSWSQCSRTCGGGVQTRRRSCDSPQPLNGGRDCPGVCFETKVCNAMPCTPGLCSEGKIFLNGTQCLRFRACSQTCADLSANVRCRTECVLRGELGGCFCPQGKYLQDGKCVGINECRCTVNYNEYEPRSNFRVDNCHCSCNNGRTICNNCSVDCGWSTWSSWSQCDRTCGTLGHVYRFRSPTNPPPSGENSKMCHGEIRQQKSCSWKISGRECPPSWGEWQSWGQCSTSCGVGRQGRSRVCKIDNIILLPSFCGTTKHFNSFRQNRRCSSTNQTLCSICPVWMQYKCSKCPRTCDSLNGEGFIGGECREDCVWSCQCQDDKYLLDGKCVDVAQCRCDVSKYELKNNLAYLEPAQSILIGCKNCTCVHGRMVCTNHTRCESNVALWEWSGWSKWSPCSHSCVNIDRIAFESIGTMQRSRKCLVKNYNLKVQIGNGNCEGVSSQFTQCGLTLCFEGSTWNNWQPWSQCDKSCDGGIQSRHRSCRGDQFNIKNCKGESVMVKSCNLQPCVDQKCPKNSRFVSGCKSCTTGNTCLAMSAEISNSKLCENDSTTMDHCETGHCSCTNSTLWQNGQCVPLNHCNCYALGEIRKNGEKFNVGRCTTCHCSGGVVNCSPKKFLNGSNVCDSTDCCFDVADNWSAWSTCSKTCGVGIKQRFSFSSTTATKYLGNWCQERVVEQEDCNIFQCGPNFSNCTGNACLNHTGGNNWSNWGECSSTCTGNNFNAWRHRYKICHGDNICSKPYSEAELCSTSVLPECENKVRTLWSSWSSCSATCLDAVSNLTSFKTRTRICLDLLNNEISCSSGSNIESKECGNLINCENQKLPTNDEECDNIMDGSVYQKCGPTCVHFCGNVKQCFSTCRSGCYCKEGQVLNRRHDACISQSQCKCINPVNGGFIENGQSFSTSHQLCHCVNGSVSCKRKKIKGGWCGWSHWTTCSGSCVQKMRSRKRSCSCPLPSNTTDSNLRCTYNNGGNNFTQNQTELCETDRTCNESGNAGNWATWSIWSSCSSTCVGGTQWRKRGCWSQSCDGSQEQTRPCHSNISCTTTNWEGWSECSLSCGQGGIRIRSRSCLKNHDCLQRDLTQFSACQEIKQACLPTLTPWSMWSICSQSCDAGIQLRSRNCKNDANYFPIENCIPNSNLSVNFLVDSDQYMSQENQSRVCVGKKCHNLVPGNQPEWSEWSFWSVCSGICGNSKQSRVRECGSNDNAVNHTVTCLGVGKIDRPCRNLFCSNQTVTFCPVGMHKRRVCDICLSDGNYRYRLPLTCDEISTDGSLKCNESDCSETCVCPDDKVMQNNECLSAHECECTDEQGNLFVGNTAWNKTSVDEYGLECRSECSCLIGRILCKSISCEEANCDVTEWGSWTSCNSSCYDSNLPSTRLRFRSARFESGTSALNCSENLIELDECRHLENCGDHECQDSDYKNKSWKPNECTSCSCHQNRTKSCSITCNDSPHCVEAVVCPEVTCPRGEIAKRKTGDCCLTCHRAEKDYSCEMSSEIRNFSLDGCRSRDMEVRFCTGACRSSVRVLPFEPFFENKCKCCKHELHVNSPYISVQLNCLDKSTIFVKIPNIAECTCESCVGFSGYLQVAEP